MTFIVNDLKLDKELLDRIKEYDIGSQSVSMSVEGKNPYSQQYSSMGGSFQINNIELGDNFDLVDTQVIKAVLSAQSSYDFLVHMYIIGEINAGMFKQQKEDLIERASIVINSIYKKGVSDDK